MSGTKIYTLKNCDSCRAAVKWLKARGLAFEERPIRETPPTQAELRAMLAAFGGDRRRIFNTSGRDYRELKLAETLPKMNDTQVLEMLAENGNLVKRPFVIGPGLALTGFDEAVWAVAFGC